VATYDVFISHNHADKPWARALADVLAGYRYNHRLLRVWLDEQVLDPGGADESEITTALDRSRHLVVGVSPESVAARWVKLEIDYFLDHHDPECRRVTVVALRSSAGFPQLERARRLDWSQPPGAALRALIAHVCPTRVVDRHPFRGVEDAFKRAVTTDRDALGPTAERDRLRDELFAFDIEDPGLEGMAVEAFERVGTLLEGYRQNWPEYSYPAQLLVGDCLASGLARSMAYRQVVRRYIDAGSPAKLSAVARALSVLAVVRPGDLDPTLVLGVATRLAATGDDGYEATVGLLSHALGKARAEPIAMFLIKMLGEGLPIARRIAAGAISLSHLVHEVALISDTVPVVAATTRLPAPAMILSGELTDMGRGQTAEVQRIVALAVVELMEAYPDDDLATWAMNWHLETIGPAVHVERGPLLGIVAKATVANMAQVAERIDPRHVVCLTEPRVVDALFDRAGAVLIPDQPDDTHLCKRLRARAVSFAMLPSDRLAALADDDYLHLDDARVTLWRSDDRERRLASDLP